MAVTTHSSRLLPLPSQKLVALLYRYARENLALVNIYIKDPAVTKIKRDQRVPIIWFIANVGGILGLTMGCSLVTIFEIVHHVIMLFLHTGRTSVSKINRSVKTGKSSGQGGDGGGRGSR